MSVRGASSSRPASSDSTDGSHSVSTENRKKSYAEVVSGTTGVATQHIQADTVNININTFRSASDDAPDLLPSNRTIKRDQAALFLEAVDMFSRGHFILIAGKQSMVEYIDAVSMVPWTAVLDFDPESRSTGLLSHVESTLNKRRSLHIGSIQEDYTFTEQITNWIFLKGCADRPDTRTAEDAGEWKKQRDLDIDRKIELLKQFGTVITHFTFVVLWPVDSNTARCMHFIIDKLCTRMSCSIVIVDDGEPNTKVSTQILNVVREENEVVVIELGVQEMCIAIMKTLKPISMDSSRYHLPTKDKLNDPGITEEKAQWLKEDFEVLYLKNTTGIEYSFKQLLTEEDIFHKGGTLPWAWWYEAGPGHADIERDQMKPMIDAIRQKYLDIHQSSIITLLHSPGSGGTTLSQGVLWNLKDQVPCAHMKQNSGSSVTDLVEKISYIIDRTLMPIVILLDGEDEHRVQSLQRLSDRHKLCVVMIYLRRFRSEIGEEHGGEYVRRNDVFLLQDKLSKREAKMLRLKYEGANNADENEKRHTTVAQLVKDIENDKHRTIFEFGLAAHSFEYVGIQSYVSAYLKLSEAKECKLLPWQTSLAYLSLVYFYGHASLPSHLFTDILHDSEHKRILEVKDFPQEMQEFIVRGVHESRMYTVRISHYYVAKEILDQILLLFRCSERIVSPYLCNEAKKLLGEFCCSFIEKAGAITDGNSSEVISKMLINTFIKRENSRVREDETTEKRMKGLKKPQFAHILEDASSKAPFVERFDILQQLVISFPSEAQFRAHLGRLYTLCRPEEEQKAEENLKKAYEMSSVVMTEKERVDEIPFSKRLDIRNICHMYGNMLSKKVFKFTGKCTTTKPLISVEKAQFRATADLLLPDVRRACEMFAKNREVMSPENDDCLGFIGEIKIRLMFCHLVKDKGGAPDLQSFVKNNDWKVAEFVNDCYASLDELFDEVCSVADEKSMERNVQPLQEMFMEIMTSSAPGHTTYKPNIDTPRFRRIEIAKLKARYKIKSSHAFLEKLNENDLNFIVKCYEMNFRTADQSDTELDSDYKQWIRAIRHPVFPKRYSIEQVFTHVRNWYEHVQTFSNPWKKTIARFYFFVLSSILGFGAFGHPGHTTLLRQSQVVRKELLEYTKFSPYPDYQRDWMGPPVSTIDRLIPGNPGKLCFGANEGLALDNKDVLLLEIRVGTVCPPNNKPNAGLIELDLGPTNRESVKIFYVPSKWKMKGKSFKGNRVEFVIGFNLSHGYKAFNVMHVGHIQCSAAKCNSKIERRNRDTEVKCPKCLQITKTVA